MKTKDRSHEELKLEVEKLRAKLEEAEETLRAIRSGEVDALVVSGEKGEQVFTLKGAEQPYRILIEEMSEGAVMLDADDSILYCNSGFAGMVKTPLEKLIGAGIADYIAPSSESLFLELLRQGREGSICGEIKLLTGDGTFVSAQFSFNTLQTDDARLVYLVATDLTGQKQKQDELQRARDELEIRVEERTEELWKANSQLQDEIAERKELVLALQESEKKYSGLYSSIKDGIIRSDTSGRILECNQAYLDMLGYTQEEILEVTYQQLTPAKWHEMETHIVDQQILRRGYSDEYKKEYIKKDGTVFPISIRVWLIMNEQGEPLGMWGIVRDITEPEHAEEELNKNRKQLQTILDNTPSIVFIKDMDGRYILFNRQWEKLFNPIGRKLHDETDYEIFPLELAEKLRANDRSVINSQTSIDFEESVHLSDGTLHTYLSTKSPIFDDSGNIFAICGISTDITERKQAEEALQESEKRYRSLFENMMDGFAYCKMLFDSDGLPVDFVCLEINSAFGRLTGLENVAGKKVTDVFPGIKESNPELFKIFCRVALTGQPETFEFEFKPLEGWFSTSVYSSEKEYFAVVFDDITERKRAEDALRKAHDELELRVQERTTELKEANKALLESEANYRGLTESIDDLFYAMDRDMRYTYWNKASEALTGILAKDAIGKSIYEIFPDVKGTKAEQFYIEVLKTQQTPRFETQFQIGGKKFIFEINAYPTETGVSVISKDITEKKKLEAQLLRSQRMESIGTLAGGIAHDLNNMLTPIMLSLELLKEKFKDEQSQKMLTILERNSQRGADLLKQVLSFARGVEGERNLLQAKHIILEIQQVAKETFPRNIEIKTDIPKDLFSIYGDATQLHQVIMNLCVNARDAMPDGGKLSISAENFFIDENYARMHTEAKVGPYIVITVSDTGIGIPPQILDRIFEPFFTTKKFGKGTGLGLSTAHAIVKSHGGFINVYSEVGKGTTFKVYLPGVKTEMQNVEEQQLELLVGQGELVLVVEDENSIREVTISTLEKYGYNVLAANNGADAVALYDQNKDKIKVILMDMMMPVMDGEASIREIRKINPEVKVIVVSGLADKDKVSKLERTHAHILLQKPYTANRLLKAIHEVLSEKYFRIESSSHQGV